MMKNRAHPKGRECPNAHDEILDIFRASTQKEKNGYTCVLLFAYIDTGTNI